MPIRRRNADPVTGKSPEDASTLQRLLAGGVRAGSGILAVEGGLPGAAITGAGEGIAELIEGQTPSLARVGVEAGLGAIPFGKVITAGKPWVATARSGLFSGVGEAGRELARGEQLDPRSIGSSTALGALFGNIFGRFGGSPKVETPPAGPAYEVEHTAVPGGRTLDEKGKLQPVGSGRIIPGSPQVPTPPGPSASPREAYWAGRGLNPPTGPGRMASAQYELPFEETASEVVEGGRIPYTGSGRYPEGAAAKSAARAAKEDEKTAQQLRIQGRIDRAIEEGQLTPGKTSVSESGSVQTPEGRMGYRTSYAAPEKEADEGSKAGYRQLDETLEPVAETTPREAAPEAEPPSPLQKLLTSAEEQQPRVPTRRPRAPKPMTPAQQASYDELLARIQAEGRPAAPEAAVAPPVAPEGPSTPSPWLRKEDIPPTRPIPGSTLPEHLRPFSSTFPSPNWGAFAPQDIMRSEGVPQEAAQVAEEAASPLARLFKTRVDAAGQGYRDIKEALRMGEAVPEEGRAIAGKALQTEGRAAGLPPTPRAPRPAGVNPPTAEGGLAQTAKAREAALAKRQAAKAAAEQQKLGLEGTESELQMAQRLKAEGVPLPEILQRLQALFGEESGSVSPAAAARLGMAATGAGIGGIFGGAQGHPIAGALVGGAIGGALSPGAIAAGLKQLGMHPQAAEDASTAVSTPEGVTEVAKRLYNGLPQFQRFNLLMDAWGLPANAIAGPYGSAAMAGLEAHLSGDPRGMEVLRRLNPEQFMKRWAAARDEAQRLIAEGELGRAETRITGAGPVQNMMQWPGVQMTAGDVAARQILVEAGFTEEEARRITMTGEPEFAAAKKVANFSKGSTLLQLLQPFARTPANIAEQGALRTPILGELIQRLGRETPDPLRTRLVQQGLGAAAGGIGYFAGEHLDPETAKIVRRYMTNLGGQYSLPVGLGFAAGQAVERGGEPLSAQTAANLYNALPLPSTAPLANWVKAATGGGAARGTLPNTLVDVLTPSTASAANPLARPGRFRR